MHWSGVFPPNCQLYSISKKIDLWMTQLTPEWPLTQLCITLWSGILLTESGSHRSFLSKLTSIWPQHDPESQQCSILRSRILPTKFGGHRPFLSKLTSIWPQLTPTMHYPMSWILLMKFGGQRQFLSKLTSGWPLHDLWPQQCITLWSGVLTKFGSHGTFLR